MCLEGPTLERATYDYKRPSRILFTSEELQEEINFPFQLGTNSDERSENSSRH